MPNNDLFDFMSAATKQMADEYQRIQKRATEDPGTAGDQGEENWATLLRGWLPSSFHVVTKGRILSEKGIASPQVDVIVLQPEYPPHLLDKKLYLAGGVLAAFECKLTLKAKHLAEFITNSVEIKNHLIKEQGTPHKEIQSKLLYGLLAHSHIWRLDKVKSVETIQNKLDESDAALITHPFMMPDIVCISDLACWTTTKIAHIGPYNTSVWNDEIAERWGSNGCTPTMYSSHFDTQGQNEGFTPIGSFISGLIFKLASRVPALRPLAFYYMQAGLQGTGKGHTRNWPIEIYSESIRHLIIAGHGRDGDRWSEWSPFIT